MHRRRSLSFALYTLVWRDLANWCTGGESNPLSKHSTTKPRSPQGLGREATGINSNCTTCWAIVYSSLLRGILTATAALPLPWISRSSPHSRLRIDPPTPKLRLLPVDNLNGELNSGSYYLFYFNVMFSVFLPGIVASMR